MKPRVAATWVVIVLLVAGLAFGLAGLGGALSAGPQQAATPAAATADASVRADPVSGLAWVELAALPPEASDTVDIIAAGPPYPYRADGETFSNREGLLPAQPEGYYREFTVETPGADDRGARRIVVGAGGEYYWTADHYDSFERIRR